MAASSSQGVFLETHIEKTPGDFICEALEDLTGTDLKRFKNKLSDFSYQDRLPIKRRRLENANDVTTKDVLIDHYGDVTALDVTVEVLKAIGLIGHAAKLEEKRNGGFLETEVGKTPGDLICDALEDLTGTDLKRFKNKLSDFSYQDRPPIKRRRLEHADDVTTKDVLLDYYGDATALDVTVEVLKVVGLIGPAGRLEEERRALIMKPPQSLMETRAEYMELIKEEYEVFEEPNARIGEGVSLKRHYTPLLIIKGHQEEEEKENEIMSTGWEHLEIMAARSSIKTSIPCLFDPNEEGRVPKSVVLQGPAGIGKTMTSRKIMLDWASDGLYQDKFHFVFHMSCRELNTITGDITLSDLLSEMCNFQWERCHLTSIFREEDKVLFIIDGFDELKSLIDVSGVCRDPFQKTSMEILLKSLLGKKLLWKSSLIVTTRPFSLESLRKVVPRPRYVAILGFTEEDRVDYIQHYFKSKEEAELALQTVKANVILYTMCVVPILCWLVCTIMKQQIRKRLDVSNCNTTTSIYLLYLESLLLYHCRRPGKVAHGCIKKLCALANEGVWLQKIFFEEEDLRRHGLSITEIESVFLAENLFHRGAGKKSFYSFLHLSIQEFFAALHYVLVGESMQCAPAGHESLPSEGRTIPKLLEEKNAVNLYLTIRFLFGLSGEPQIREAERCLHSKISFREKPILEKWLRRRNELYDDEVLCLYEAQDVEMVRRVMGEKETITVGGYKSDLEFRATSYCLMNSDCEHRMNFESSEVRSKSLSIMSEALQKCPEIWINSCKFWDDEGNADNISYLCESLKSHPGLLKLQFTECKFLNDQNILRLCKSLKSHPGLQILHLMECGLTSSSCADLSSLISSNRSLDKLDLFFNGLQDSGIKLLCEGLKDPRCTLQKLRLAKCGLTSSCCVDLCSVISTNQSLITLDLSGNNLQDSGIKLLCEGLIHSKCILRKLRLMKCGLTSSCCGDLSSVIFKSQSLTLLVLSHNDLQDSGINLLCEGLKHPLCTLQKLRLMNCNLTSACCADLCSVISTNRSLTALYLSCNDQLDCTILHERVRERDASLPELRIMADHSLHYDDNEDDFYWLAVDEDDTDEDNKSDVEKEEDGEKEDDVDDEDNDE